MKTSQGIWNFDVFLVSSFEISLIFVLDGKDRIKSADSSTEEL